MSAAPLPRTEQSVALTVAVDGFLDRFRDDPTTRNTYAETLPGWAPSPATGCPPPS